MPLSLGVANGFCWIHQHTQGWECDQLESRSVLGAWHSSCGVQVGGEVCFLRFQCSSSEEGGRCPKMSRMFPPTPSRPEERGKWRSQTVPHKAANIHLPSGAFHQLKSNGQLVGDSLSQILLCNIWGYITVLLSQRRGVQGWPGVP